jgi:hypothetical protein
MILGSLPRLAAAVGNTTIPEEVIREVALSAPGLHGIRLQVIEDPTGAGRFESVPLQLVDVSGAVAATHQLLPMSEAMPLPGH